MYCFIRLFAICSLFCMYAGYAAQTITMLYPYGVNSRISQSEKLRNASEDSLKAVIRRTQETPGSVFMYSFDCKYEQRGTPEIYDGPVYGCGTFANAEKIAAHDIVGSVADKLNLKKDFFVHLVSHLHYYTSHVSSERLYLAGKSREYYPGAKLESFYRPSNIRSTDTVIYVIGDDVPEKDPEGFHLPIDAQWHAQRICSLKGQCDSVLVLVSKNCYEKLAPAINRICKVTYCDIAKNEEPKIKVTNFATDSRDETTIAPVKSYRPLFIIFLGLAALACGVFYYKCFMNGSALNSSLFSAKEI